MTCVIIDDEPHAIDVLKRYVEQSEVLQLLGTFRNPAKALPFVQQEKPDLIFLDINMPGMTGLQFMQSLPRKPLVIFTTAYSDYGAESYEWDAVDYLLKPILRERFMKAVNKAIGISGRELVVPPKESTVLLKSGGQVYPVRLADVLYITKDSNYLEVHTTERKILVRATMNDVFSIFPEALFCRIHKSHAVALRHIRMADAHEVEIGKVKLPLGATYRDEFMKRLKPS